MKELAERFDRENIAIRVKARTAKGYRRSLERFILPALGQFTLAGITWLDVAKFHCDLLHIPYQANRCLEVVSKMFTLACKRLSDLQPFGQRVRVHAGAKEVRMYDVCQAFASTAVARVMACR